jgi:hypothetical protein
MHNINIIKDLLVEKIKIGIVIQGSLESQGFDCVQNCNELIKIFSDKDYVERIVLSTWENENTEYINKEVIILKNRPVLNVDLKNRQKQFLSTFEGVKYLINNSDVTHVLKLRTDQLVPVEILDEIIEVYGKSYAESKFMEQPLTFCYINRTIPFHIGDFFFVGGVSDMYRFCHNVLSFGSFNFQGAVEVDVVLKHLYREDSNFPIPFYICYKQMCIARQFPLDHLVWNYWRDIYKTDFYTFSQSILEKTQWRGLYWIDEANRRGIYGNNIRATESFYNFFDFSKESDLVKSDEKKYLSLAIDIQYGKVKYIKDFLAFVNLYLSYRISVGYLFMTDYIQKSKNQLKQYIKKKIRR